MTATAGSDVRPLLVPTRVAAAMLDLDEDRVRDLIRAGELPGVRIASKAGVEARKLRIPVTALEAFVERLVEEQRAESV